MARILLATPDGQQVVELRDHNSLGRHPSNTIQLLDKIVSKEHCVIERRGATYVLRDLGSLNGTYVNAERVNGERELRHGDDIALGGTRGRYDDGSGRPMPNQQQGGTQALQAQAVQFTQPVQQFQPQGPAGQGPSSLGPYPGAYSQGPTGQNPA